LQLALCCIVKQIKAAVKDHPMIIEKLKGRVRLPATGESLLDPYTSENLSGIYQIMYLEFNKASMVVFAKMLLEVITHEVSLEVCDANPTKAVLDIEQTMKSWNQLGLWKFMDQDRFFVVCFLRSLHPRSDMRRNCVREVTEFIRKIEQQTNGEEVSIEMSSDLPILTYVCDWVRGVYVPSLGFDHQKGDNNGNARSTGTGSGEAVIKKPFNRNPKQRSDKSEQAASANTESDNKKNLKPAAAKYNREVHRKEMVGITCTANGREHLYTATKVGCAKCNNSNKAEDKHQPPRCYWGQCRKCNLFGHKHGDCRQEVVTSKSNNTANSAEEEDEVEDEEGEAA
jgi:hypothetical protein